MRSRCKPDRKLANRITQKPHREEPISLNSHVVEIPSSAQISRGELLRGPERSCKDAVACQDHTKRPTRLRYEWDTIFAIKEHSLVSDLNVDDTLFRVNTVPQRSGCGKSKCTQSKTQCDRPRDTGAIVLGSQKRIGIRVATDTGFTRAGNVSDYRRKERQLSRNPGDFKRDFRGAGRGGLRRNEGQFSRGRFHDRHRGQRPGHFAEEPEWFSEGPTTVTETIELGCALEDEDGDNSVIFGRKLATPPISLTDGGDRETDDVSDL
ncbi:hypothetical protein X801_07246 [Opisthorchis viverrini]|uniref:Uncharacterized protein n=1 Tax=Opisthorchis viverrini TaxID=6198 RepID=A0A1S8WRD1_OPIVI|nr:hypothetical protein X801_07246 [Opisthorchis viverrini]